MTPPSSSPRVCVPESALTTPASTGVHTASWHSLRLRRWFLTLGTMLLATAIVVLVALKAGSHGFTWAQFWAALSLSGAEDAEIAQVILWDVRFPRILMALFVGAALAVTGAVLQALVRNPLADPYVLGIAGGAALGATVGLASGLGAMFGGIGLQMCALIGGGLSIVLVYGIAVSQGTLSVHTLLLAGVILNAVCSALMMFATSILNPAALYRVVMWLMGTLTAPTGATTAMVAVSVAIAIAWLLRHSAALNLLALGEEASRSMGVESERVQRVVFIVSAILTGIVVSLCGMIGFVGMVVPHMVRMLFGADHRLLLPTSALGGGMLLIIADTVARTVVAPAEIPVGVITALIGGPFFLYLLVTRKYRFTT